MKSFLFSLPLAIIILDAVEAYVPSMKPVNKMSVVKSKQGDIKKAALASFTALTIASNILIPVAQASDLTIGFSPFSSSNVVAEKVTKQGLYGDYEIDVVPQTVDDARSTFKPAKETKSKKGM